MNDKSRSVTRLDWDPGPERLRDSQQFNQECKISGVPLASHSHFLRILEGRYEDVNAALRKILRYTLHPDFYHVEFSVTDYRLFSAWAMRGIGIFDINEDLEQGLVK